jgi:hypothetical protein
VKKTHRVVRSPQIPVQYLADYMAASNQVRRSIVQKAKYKSLARVFQHQMARRTISDHIIDGNPIPGDLKEKSDGIRNLLADTDFDTQLNGYNADFVSAFAAVAAKFDFSGFQLIAPRKITHPIFNGTQVQFSPNLFTYRATRANTHKIGGIMFRYARGEPVPKDAAEFQTAFIYGFFSISPFMEDAKPEDKLCLVLDAVSGETFIAPDKPIYKFNEMKAVCGDIAEKWENVAPPPGAII